MVIGDRVSAGWRRWVDEDGDLMAEVLHTDDPNAVGNLTAEEYQRAWELRAARLGDTGLHVLPQEYLDRIGGADDADR